MPPREYCFWGASRAIPRSSQRNIEISGAAAPAESSTGFVSRFFDMAGVARVNLYRAGEDFPRILEGFEQEAQNRGMRVRQIFIDLGQPCSGWTVARLRERGYFIGGFLPRWFDTDGLLMQKVNELPNPASIKLHSKRARRILEFLREDIRSNPAYVQKVQAYPEAFSFLSASRVMAWRTFQAPRPGKEI